MSTNAGDLPGGTEPIEPRHTPPTAPTTPTTPARPAPAVTAERRRTSISSRTGYAWSGLVAGALILVVLLIFILQNLQSIRLSLFFWSSICRSVSPSCCR